MRCRTAAAAGWRSPMSTAPGATCSSTGCRRPGARSQSIASATSSASGWGKRPELPIVLTGSHLDTQPKGGKFDGVYGVLAGLEAIRALERRRHRDRADCRRGQLDQRGRRAHHAQLHRFRRLFRWDSRGRSAGGAGQRWSDRRRGIAADRLHGRGGAALPRCWRLYRGAHRAGADPRTREEDDRRRHRHPGHPLDALHAVRHRPPRRHHADGPPVGYTGRHWRDHLPLERTRQRATAGCAHHRRPRRAGAEFDQHGGGEDQLHHRPAASLGTDARQIRGRDRGDRRLRLRSGRG